MWHQRVRVVVARAGDAGMTATPSLGWIGLGTMGQPMATRLLKAGYPLTVWNRTSGKAASLQAMGARAAFSPRNMARDCDITIIMVSGPADVEAVCLGEQGAVEGLAAGKVLIDMSTVGPATSRTIAQAVTARGAQCLDAPVSGSLQPATEGKLIVMVGGPQSAYQQCRPIFQVLGQRTVHAGDAGMGSAMKLVINLILAHQMAALSEATILAERLGLNMQDILDIAATGPLQAPWFQRQGMRVLKRDFAPNFALKHMHKDINLALALAKEAGVPLKVTEAIQWLYDQAASTGKSDLNYSAILSVVEAGLPPQFSVDKLRNARAQ